MRFILNNLNYNSFSTGEITQHISYKSRIHYCFVKQYLLFSLAHGESDLVRLHSFFLYQGQDDSLERLAVHHVRQVHQNLLPVTQQLKSQTPTIHTQYTK